MKNIIGSILFAISVICCLGLVWGYEASNINTIQLFIYEAIAFAVGYIGYKMIDIKED